MSVKFWIFSAVYHAVVGAVAFQRARRWQRYNSMIPSFGGFALAIIRDVAICGATAFGLAFIVAAPFPDRPFAVIRFWSQTLFGEALLFCSYLAILHWRRQRIARGVSFAIPVLMLLGVYVNAYHIEPFRLRVERYELTLGSPLSANHTQTIRLLHISDIQAHRIGDFEHRIVRQAAPLAPDIVVMTGDYVQERHSPTGTRTARKLCDLILREGPHPPLGTYAVGGDTDDFGLEHMFMANGIRWLNDETVTINLPKGPPLAIIGLAHRTSWRARPDTLRRLIAETPPQSIRVIIGHAPDYMRKMDGSQRVDLVLAGHTHGGQVVIPFFGPPLTLSRVPRRIAAGGMHEYNGVPLHVSRGVGMERGSAPQIRFLCPPEISLLTLRY